VQKTEENEDAGKLYNCMNTDGVILVKSKRPTEIFYFFLDMENACDDELPREVR